jgi:hypothetical protein
LVLTVAASALFFLPRVTVEPSGPYDPLQPSPITFTITNINIVPLRNVKIGIGLCYLYPTDEPGASSMRSPEAGREKEPIECNGPTKTIPSIDAWSVKWLDTDEKWQIALEQAVSLHSPQQIEKANITIAVTYSPWLMPWPWRYTREFRFITKKLSDGKIYWIPTPLNH